MSDAQRMANLLPQAHRAIFLQLYEDMGFEVANTYFKDVMKMYKGNARQAPNPQTVSEG